MARDALNDTEKYQVIGGVLSPVADSYEKPGLIAANHRLAMCKLAVADSDWIAVDEWEAAQSEYQTTIKVLHNIRDRVTSQIANGGHEIQVMLLSGADLIKSFAVPGLWDVADREDILGRFGCVIVDRWHSDISEFLLTDPILYKYRKNIHVVKQFISNDISSTKIRLFIGRNLSVKYLLPDSVIEYIRKHNLYR